MTQEQTSAATASLRLARKVVVAVIGFSVLGFGVALIVFPGPAVIVIPIGLAILATEFLWAGKSLVRMRMLLLPLRARVRQMLARPTKSVDLKGSHRSSCFSGPKHGARAACSRLRSRGRTIANQLRRIVSEAQSPVDADPDQTFSAGEELAHSVTHGVGLLLAIAALVLMVVFAARAGSALHVVSCAIYGVTLVVLYASSTLYHGLPAGRGKRVFGILDYSAIFLLIAGTYTPFVLVTLSGPLGWSLFAVIWGLAVGGVVLEAVSHGRARRIQLVLYLLMGWGIVGAVQPLLQQLALGGLVLLLAGGLAYTLGVTFYVWRRPFFHALWHLFVLGGSICHFFAVFLYVMP